MANLDFEPITEKQSFESLLEELESIAKRLEEGKIPLSEALGIYTRGIQVKTACEERLNQAQLTIEQLQKPE